MSDLHQLRALCQSVANGEPHAEAKLRAAERGLLKEAAC